MTLRNECSAVVVDDHPLVARGIADYLRTHCGFARAEAICHANDKRRAKRLGTDLVTA